MDDHHRLLELIGVFERRAFGVSDLVPALIAILNRIEALERRLNQTSEE